MLQLNDAYFSPPMGQLDWQNRILEVKYNIVIQGNVDFQAAVMLLRQRHERLVGFLVETMME